MSTHRQIAEEILDAVGELEGWELYDDSETKFNLVRSIESILNDHFEQVVDARQQTISFTPAFNVSMNSTSSNSTPKENDLDRRKEETRYNSRNPKGRTEYTPRRDGNVRDKSK